MHQPIDNRAILNRVQKSATQISQRDISQSPQNQPVKSFEEILRDLQTPSEVTISKHAMERLQSRSVTLSETDLKRVSQAMDQASKKGIKDAVIVLGDNVLIASINNKTIITASKKDDLKEQIITNINGAILL